MKEVRSPKRPMIFYYCMVLLIIFLFNMLIAPLLGHSQVTEVGYNTFMDMIDDRDIGLVQIEDTEIIFTNKEQSKTYETTAMEDPGLAERLHNCGAEFERIIEEPVFAALQYPAHYRPSYPDLHCTGTLYEQKADGAGGRQEFHGLWHGEK